VSCRLVNVTPHPIPLHTADGIVELPPSGTVARCATTDTVVATIDAIEVGAVKVHAIQLGELVDLPAPQPGTYYVASLIAAQAARRAGRDDVFAPGPGVWDKQGRIVGYWGVSAP